MEIRMPKIPIREGVGCSLQPHDDRMNLAQGPNQGMVDVEVDNDGCYQQAERRVDSMDPGYYLPRRLEFLDFFCCWDVTSSWCSRSTALFTCSFYRLPCLLSSGKLYDICNEKMAWYDK